MKRAGALLLSIAAIGFAQSDDEIRRILSDRIDRDHKGLGIAVGVVDSDGQRRIVAHGDVRPDSLFEIGSVTKVFTALVLTDMAERAEVALTDPVAKYLPEGVRMPQRGRAITLEDLASHMSGLPRLPTAFLPKNMADPYADYTPERLYDFLRTYELPRAPGEKWEYSNLGFGLLGHALALRAHNDYETLVRLRICGPLDMTNTWIQVPPREREARMAVGHSVQLRKVGYWTFTDAMAGAGAFVSSTGDLLEFVAANLGHKKSGLAPAMAAMLAKRYPTGAPIGQAVGWNTITQNGAELIWKDGGTLGFASFIGFDPKRRAGVVVLSDASVGVNDLGLQLLGQPERLRTAPSQKRTP